jgi:UDP-N-acetylmuramyl pentapeptide phosphotransferase/UDP-N-acetylglucosamine-1-phosphate transferase
MLEGAGKGMLVPFALLVVMAASFGLVPAATPIFARAQQKNYTGRYVPTGLGLPFVLLTACAWLIAPPSIHGVPSSSPVVILLGFSLLGLVDDLLGTREHRGYKGHFRALMGGKLTTGGLKALGGGLLAVLASFPQAKGLWDGAAGALMVLLAANAINLVDLRPGRAGKAFVLLGIVLTAFRPEARWIAPLAAAVVGYLPWDLRGEVMMGDTGANPLGAVLGFACWSSLTGPPRIAVIAALLALNAAAERISFSQFIACHPFLDWLDKLGRDEGK